MIEITTVEATPPPCPRCETQMVWSDIEIEGGAIARCPIRDCDHHTIVWADSLEDS